MGLPNVISNFEWPYLRNGSSDLLHVSLLAGVLGSANRMALFPVGSNSIKVAAGHHLGPFELPYLRDPIIHLIHDYQV